MNSFDTYSFNNREKLFIAIVYIIVSITIALLFYKSLTACVLSAFLIPFVLNKIKAYKIEIRRKRLMEEFKDFLFSIASLIGARNSLRKSIQETVEVIHGIYGKDSVLKGELMEMHIKMEYMDDVEVLKEFAQKTGIEDVYDFAQIYETCKYTGANMIAAITMASNVIIEKMTIEKEIYEIIHRKKKEGYIILIMPIAVLLLLNICAADYISVLYNNLEGKIIMTLVIFSYVIIYKLIERITDIRI
jgi:tight adherence protein B